MPELPEVEHVVRALRRVIVGRTIIASEVRLPKLIAPLSVSSFNRRIKHSKIAGVSRRGKFILIECQKPDRKRGQPAKPKPLKEKNLVLAVHLRMTGKFLYLTPDDDLPKHSHAIFYLDNDRRLVFRDQRQFGVMKLIESSVVSQTRGIKELAPEPFGDEFSLESTPAYCFPGRGQRIRDLSTRRSADRRRKYFAAGISFPQFSF